MSDETAISPRREIWLRGLYMVIFAVLFGLAQTLLLIAAVLQFGWLLFSGHRNEQIASFGASLGRWLTAVARFQTAESEAKPFPWAPWGK